MASRGKSICRKVGCGELIDRPGYCDKHIVNEPAIRKLSENKTPEMKKFYGSAAWTRTSKAHRSREPLCARCLSRGIVKAAELVHHDPPAEELIAKGLNPYDPKYLQSLCNTCHLEDLRAKRG